jgi:putative membrane protein
MSDPRVFFAAERTLLAWVRSGLTMMAFGFVVARFGLFLGLLPASNQSAGSMHDGNWISSTLGIALVVLGAGVILGALSNHRLYVRTLPLEDIPQVLMPWLTSFLSVVLALIGFLLAAYLAFV